MLGTGVFQVVAHLVDLAGADQLLGDQLLGATVVVLQLAQLGLGLGHGQAGAVGVQPHQRLPGLDLLALLHQHLQRHSGGLGHHLGFGQRLQRGGAGITGGNRPPADLGNLHRHRFHLGLAVLAILVRAPLLAGLAAGQGRNQEEGDRDGAQ